MRSATRKKLGKDPRYRRFIAGLPCCICHLLAQAVKDPVVNVIEQATRTEIAHVGERGLSQKCPDRETIPLCVWHHRTGPESAHRAGVRFWQIWGLDKDELIRVLNERYDAVAL